MSHKDIDVLVIEDNLDDLSFSLRILRKSYPDLEIEVARTANQARDYVFQRGEDDNRLAYPNPKLILLDLGLPSRTKGLELLGALKSDSRTQAIPVVVFTSSDEEADSLESYRLGVNSYVRKPIHLEEFRQALNQILFYWLDVQGPSPSQPRSKSPPPEHMSDESKHSSE